MSFRYPLKSPPLGVFLLIGLFRPQGVSKLISSPPNNNMNARLSVKKRLGVPKYWIMLKIWSICDAQKASRSHSKLAACLRCFEMFHMLFMLDFVCIIFNIIEVYGMNCTEELSF